MQTGCRQLCSARVVRNALVLSLVPLACTSARLSPTAPAGPPVPPVVTATSAAATASAPDPASSNPPELTPNALYRAFLAADDVGERFQSILEPDVARGLNHHYRSSPKPDGLQWVADATWSDPHGYERLRRLEETRWYFTDEATASRFVESQVIDLREHWRSEDTEGPSFGSDCHVLKGTVEGTTGPSTHYVYVFRVARLVAQVWFAQGPRSHTPLTQELVVPLARRAAERVAGAQSVAVSSVATARNVP
jgi:hypothetical protein